MFQNAHIDHETLRRSRTTDPITSHIAAERAKDLADRHKGLIVGTLKKFGALGKDGIASHLDGIDGVAVARRLKELEKGGEIVATGKTVSSNSGRQEREWRAA